MQDLKGKCVFITGASSGIGEACARQFAALGAKLLLCARRTERLSELARTIAKEHQVAIHYFTCDVRDRVQVTDAFKALPTPWQQVDILVNNAGLALEAQKLQDGDPTDWEQMLDTNVKGLLYVTKAVLPGMLERNSGHIINIGSVAGVEVYPGGAVYCASKFAVRALSDGIKTDVHGSNIRVSEVQPGMVETEFSNVRFKGNAQRADKVYQGFQPLTADDIADTIVYCATRPAHVDVRRLWVMPTAQTSATLCHRE
jgi:3-hydroxy acid dehydrogenase / malonic semialdehyde reductase